MEKKFSQLGAMLAITKASFKAQLKSPSALVFGFVFPLFFILIFGSGMVGMPQTKFRLSSTTDTSSTFYKILDTSKQFNQVRHITNLQKVTDSLLKGNVSAIISIKKNSKDSTNYIVTIQASKANEKNVDFVKMVFQSIFYNLQRFNNAYFKETYTLNIAPSIGDRVYKSIDFHLPGQLGFSLLSAGLFGVAFLFFNLRDTLVLKRLNATPIKKPFIILGECLARVMFQLVIVTLIILLGRLLFNFTLVNGMATFGALLILSFIGLVVFMGFGFVISGAAKSINTVPVLTNLIGFPQFMLSGTFFPYEGLPKFLHPICKSLPLTHLNIALRKVAFEGLPLVTCLPEIGILLLWTIVIYAIAFKIFKWE